MGRETLAQVFLSKVSGPPKTHRSHTSTKVLYRVDEGSLEPTRVGLGNLTRWGVAGNVKGKRLVKPMPMIPQQLGSLNFERLLFLKKSVNKGIFG